MPGLSDAALAAVGRLKQAGADRLPSIVPGKAAAEDARAASGTTAWSAVAADRPVADELRRFADAARKRLGAWVEPSGHRGTIAAGEIADVLAATSQLVSRHAANETARADQQRRNDLAALEPRDKQARQAEMDRRYQEYARRHLRGRSAGLGMG